MQKHIQALPFHVPSDHAPKHRIIVFSGMPGVGKTLCAARMARLLRAVHVNADVVRSTITKHLGFSAEDRLRQAETLGHMCRIVADSGHRVVVDFVAPTWTARQAFAGAVGGEHQPNVVWYEIHKLDFKSRFEDTNKLYQPMMVAGPSFEVDLGIDKKLSKTLTYENDVLEVESQVFDLFMAIKDAEHGCK